MNQLSGAKDGGMSRDQFVEFFNRGLLFLNARMGSIDELYEVALICCLAPSPARGEGEEGKGSLPFGITHAVAHCWPCGGSIATLGP